MKQSQLFYKTRKETPADADSINASYFIRAGFAHKHMAGVYALLPLGFRVLKKIEQIIREEMNTIGGQEILMNVLQPKELWEETGRWQSAVDIFYKLRDSRGKELCLAPTHEEETTDIVRGSTNSYKNLPIALYQIQAKFRNEPRAKSGLLRGREFIMKDLYSFHTSEDDLWRYYDVVRAAYFKIFDRLGLSVKLVEASGGVFSKFSHEFQVLTPVGEDTIYYCDKCDFAQNKEIAKVKDGDKCPGCDGRIKMDRGIEVGNIFPLMARFSEPMGAVFLDRDGKEKVMVMGSYGIGLTRAMATVAEMKYDAAKNAMVWPGEIAPYRIHLISLNKNDQANRIYDELRKKNIEVLFDDRDISAGEKFAEADLIGCPIRLIISEKSLAAGGAELVDRIDNKIKIVSVGEISREIKGITKG
ncbi:MAG: aminoacyl--tRNA ligase-related protein [Patescibacteria group bacterium]